MLESRPAVNSALAIAALCSVAAVWGALVWQTGPQIGEDSVTYLDAARNLLASRGLVHTWAYWDPVYQTCALPTATTMWPPAYPLSIAAVSSLGLDPTQAARLISLVSFVLIPFPLFSLIRTAQPAGRAFFFTLYATCLFPYVGISGWVGAEPAFLLAATVAAWSVARALNSSSSRSAVRWFLLAGAAAGVSILFRYVGIACAAAVGIAALYAARRIGARSGWKLVVGAGVPPAAAAVALWLQGVIASRGLGPGWPGSDIFASTLLPSLKGVIGAWIGPKELLDASPWSLLRHLQIGLFAGLALMTALTLPHAFRRKIDGPAPEKCDSGALGVLALFVSAYVVTILAGRAAKGMDVEERYIVVIAPWLMTILMLLAFRGPDAAALKQHSVVVGNRALIHGVLFALFACQLAVTGYWMRRAPDSGYIVQAQGSPAVAWIRANVPAQQVLLATRGSDLAYWCPNPLLRLPRAPFSSIRTVDWATVDKVAARAGARLLVHCPGYPARLKYNRDEFDFLRRLDDPSAFPDRSPIVLPGAIIYRVGGVSDAGVAPPQ